MCHTPTPFLKDIRWQPLNASRPSVITLYFWHTTYGPLNDCNQGKDGTASYIPERFLSISLPPAFFITQNTTERRRSDPSSNYLNAADKPPLNHPLIFLLFRLLTNMTRFCLVASITVIKADPQGRCRQSHIQIGRLWPPLMHLQRGTSPWRPQQAHSFPSRVARSGKNANSWHIFRLEVVFSDVGHSLETRKSCIYAWLHNPHVCVGAVSTTLVQKRSSIFFFFFFLIYTFRAFISAAKNRCLHLFCRFYSFPSVFYRKCALILLLNLQAAITHRHPLQGGNLHRFHGHKVCLIVPSSAVVPCTPAFKYSLWSHIYYRNHIPGCPLLRSDQNECVCPDHPPEKPRGSKSMSTRGSEGSEAVWPSVICRPD